MITGDHITGFQEWEVSQHRVSLASEPGSKEAICLTLSSENDDLLVEASRGEYRPEGKTMIVLHDCRSSTDAAPRRPSSDAPGSTAAGPQARRAAEAVLLGEMDLEKASLHFGIAAPLLETWLRALLAAGLLRAAGTKRS